MLDRIAGQDDATAFAQAETAVTYRALMTRIRAAETILAGAGLTPGAVVTLEGDTTPDGAAALFAAWARGLIVAPVAPAAAAGRDRMIRIAGASHRVVIESGAPRVLPTGAPALEHPLYAGLRAAGRPGLVLFSSGSTGAPKAIVHDVERLLARFERPGRPFRAVAFLLFDHIGGLNTIIHMLAYGGCLITPPDRTPDGVLGAIARHRADLLPTSPTFLNLVLLSEAWRRHDVSSLRTITYGTEPMPPSTLARLHALWPDVRLQQTYGLSEIGILRTRSRDSGSLWMRIGGDDETATRVVDGLLEVKTATSMLGYLNAPSPFTADGWFRTGDAVEVDGDEFRILGRRSELINVGGEKVYPAEVEDVLQQMPELAEAVVYGEAHPITGQIVCARVTPRATPADPRALIRAARAWCLARLPAFKTPARIEIAAGSLHGARFKKTRAPAA